MGHVGSGVGVGIVLVAGVYHTATDPRASEKTVQSVDWPRGARRTMPTAPAGSRPPKDDSHPDRRSLRRRRSLNRNTNQFNSQPPTPSGDQPARDSAVRLIGECGGALAVNWQPKLVHAPATSAVCHADGWPTHARGERVPHVVQSSPVARCTRLPSSRVGGAAHRN